MNVGRLAPTPSGDLHLGNVVAFAAAALSIRSVGGELLLRIEDVDVSRSRSSIEAGQRRDLMWLGLHWDREVPRQSERDYQPVLNALAERAYPCECTRAVFRKAGNRCVCSKSGPGAIRFGVAPGDQMVVDRRFGPTTVDPAAYGDPVLRGRDGVFAYNLAVVADDIADGVTEVVRGADLLEFTAVQAQIWGVLAARQPSWLHSPLILGSDGKKLSKTHSSTSIAELRDAQWTPRDVWRVVLPWLGLEGIEVLEDAIEHFQPTLGPLGPIRITAGCRSQTPGQLSWVQERGG